MKAVINLRQKHFGYLASSPDCAGLVASRCKREERGFRVQPPNPSDAEQHAVSELVPGGKTPSPPMKLDYEENAYAMSEGQRWYQSFNCVGCHAHGGGGMGPPLMDAQWLYGSKPEQISRIDPRRAA